MKRWKIALARDTAVPSLGLHGLYVACNGLPNVEVVEEVPVVDDRVIPGAAPLDDSLRGVHTPGASLFLKSNRHAVWDLIRSIEEDRQPVSSAGNARLTLEMIYAVYASHFTGSVVQFPLADRTHPLERR